MSIISIKSTGIGLVLVSLTLAPLAAWAGDATLSPTPSANPAAQSWFCRNIDEFENRSEGKRLEREKRLAIRRDQSDRTRVERWVQDNRSRFDRDFVWDDSRADRFAASWARRFPTAQGSLFTGFQSQVDSQISQARSQVESAITSYQSSVLSMITQRRQEVDAALARFEASVRAAIAKAKADCSAGRDPRLSRDEFRASLRAAADQLRQDLEVLDEFRDTLRDLQRQRRDLFRSVSRQLDDQLDKTKDDLRSALRALGA